MRTFHLLVANTLLANVTNNFLWFALTFWVYLETKSVMATAIIGGGYMLLFAVSGMFFGGPTIPLPNFKTTLTAEDSDGNDSN